MFLRAPEIDGFKCFTTGFSIEFHNGLNVLVGENGAGKTGVTSAIRQLFNDTESGKRSINERYYRGFEPASLPAKSIHIEATFSFSELDQDESTAFVDCAARSRKPNSPSMRLIASPVAVTGT